MVGASTWLIKRCTAYMGGLLHFEESRTRDPGAAAAGVAHACMYVRSKMMDRSSDRCTTRAR
jgi:hypothetical protein